MICFLVLVGKGPGGEGCTRVGVCLGMPRPCFCNKYCGTLDVVQHHHYAVKTDVSEVLTFAWVSSPLSN